MQCQLYPPADLASFDGYCAVVRHLVKTEVIKIHQNPTGLDLRNVWKTTITIVCKSVYTFWTKIKGFAVIVNDSCEQHRKQQLKTYYNRKMYVYDRRWMGFRKVS